MQTVLLGFLNRKKEFESEEHLKHWLLRVIGEREPQDAALFLAADLGPAGGVAGRTALGGPGQGGAVPGGDGAGAKYRLTIYLYYYEGCTVAEVAAALRANPSTVQTWLLRARERLRRELSGQEEKEGQRYVRPQIVP